MTEVFTAAKSRSGSTQVVDDVAFLFEKRVHEMIVDILNKAQHPDDGSWEDGCFGVFIVKTHVTSCDRGAKDSASVPHSGESFFEGPVYVGFVRVAEVEAVCDGQRLGTAANDVSCRLGDCDLPTAPRVQIHVPPVTVRFHRQRLAGALDPHHTRI